MTTHEQFEHLKFAPKSPEAKGKWVECETCHRPFYVSPARIRQVEKKGHRIRFCSLKCRPYAKEENPFWQKHHKEESIKKMMEHPNHTQFISGPTNPNIRRFGHSFRGKSREWWRQHLIEEVGQCERCGYSIYPEILELHHIDRNKRHNRRDNLLLLCPTCHDTDHYLARDGNHRRKKTD